jgi:hypothetical protein
MPSPREPSPPWWLVPNLLALDAPLVAAVWQRFLGDAFGVPVPVAATVALTAAVWAIYLLDRGFDAAGGAAETDRHRFAGRHLRWFVGFCADAALVAFGTARLLPPSYWVAGGAVAAGVGLYLAAVHATGWNLGQAKEPLVAVGFAAGVTLPLTVGDVAPADWLPAAGAFAGLCGLNCRLIARWESAAPRPGVVELTLGVGLLAGAAWLGGAVGAAVGGAVVCLGVVAVACRDRPRPARALADAVLLTPLLWWPT